MKKILLPIIVFITAFSSLKAQTDYCKDIKKFGNAFSTPLPNWKGNNPSIQLSFGKNVIPTGAVLQLSMGTNLPGSAATKTTASILFEDGSKLEYPDLSILPLPPGYGTFAVNLPVSNSDMAQLRTKIVKSFTILGQTTTSISDDYKNRIIGFANCPIFADEPANETSSASVNAVNPNEKKSIDGFWGITFGSSTADVKAAIIAKGGTFNPNVSKPDMLFFENALFTQRKTTLISTKFINDKFFESAVVFPAPDDAQIIGTFQTIQSELEGVYGPSKLEKSFQPPYTDGDGYTVQAIKLGKALYMATWKTNNGNTILLQINKEGSISMFYTDRTLEKAKDAKKSSDY